MTQEEIKVILSKIFMQIKNGELDGAWEVYDEFRVQLTNEHDY